MIKSKSSNNIKRMDTNGNNKRMIKSNSVPHIVDLSQISTQISDEIMHVMPYISIKNFCKCTISQTFPLSILKDSNSDNLDLAVCLAEPEPDIFDIYLNRNRTTINTGPNYRRNENDYENGED